MTVTGLAGVACGLLDLAQDLSHEGYELVQRLEPSDFPRYHVLHTASHTPGGHGCIAPKLDHERLLGGKR